MFKRNSGWLLSLIMLSLFGVCSFCFWAVRAQDPPSNVRTDPPVATAQTTTTQTDLSGAYTGTFNCDVLGLTGPTTLTITGNDFTTADGKTGRIVASTTGGYTAVALQLTATGTDPATAPKVVSLRGRKSGSRLTLTSVGGAGEKCSFVPGRGVARGRRNQPATPDATGTEVANPSAVPTTTPTESPMPEQNPSPVPTPTPGSSPSPMPSPTPGEPMPTPSPGASPSPVEPMPSPTPDASPSPGASPTPSPSPSPSPSR